VKGGGGGGVSKSAKTIQNEAMNSGHGGKN
jgi:hypothetical protein